MKRINSIEIKSSAFFVDDFKLEFSDKLNCIMGGRGTGKSSLLYMIEACIDQDAENKNKNIFDILKNNLYEGVITLYLEDEDGQKYKIIKSFNEEPQPFLMPNETAKQINRIQSKIVCDIYEASEIERIGEHGNNRLELLDKMIKDDINNLMAEIKKCQIELEDNTRLIKKEMALNRSLEDKIKGFMNVEEDLETLKKGKPVDIKKEENEQFETADKNEKIRHAEKRFIDQLINNIMYLIGDIDEKCDEFKGLLVKESETRKFINHEIMLPILQESNTTIDKIISTYESNKIILNTTLKRINILSEKLNETHLKQQQEFFKLKQKFEKHKKYITEYNNLSKKVDEKNSCEKIYKANLKKIDNLKAKRKNVITVLNEQKKEIFNKRHEVIKKLNSKFNGDIKITLAPGGITDMYENALKNALKGSGLRYNILIPYIVNNLPPDVFAQAIQSKDTDKIKKISGIDVERSKDLIDALYEKDDIYLIEGIYCPDLPDFWLKVDSKNDKNKKNILNYKKTEELSTGQRCTTVLPIVFEVSNNPLIIDQPEDNLDNKYITDTIHDIIRQQKTTRQLIFITHNPNIPVLSDSEHNVFLKFQDKKSSIDKSGTVDDVKINILNILEGGEDAFNRRREKYGV